MRLCVPSQAWPYNRETGWTKFGAKSGNGKWRVERRVPEATAALVPAVTPEAPPSTSPQPTSPRTTRHHRLSSISSSKLYTSARLAPTCSATLTKSSSVRRASALPPPTCPPFAGAPAATASAATAIILATSPSDHS